MKKILKISAIVVIAILVIFAVLIASIPFLFPPEKMRAMLVNELTSLTGRQVSVKKLQFNIFKGIELDNVIIKESDGQGSFIKDDVILLRYNLFALFARQLVIYKFELVSPYAEIIKDKDGRFNFSDMFNKNQNVPVKAKSVSKSKMHKKSQPLPTPVPQTTASSQPAKSDFIKNVIITSVGVKNGVFSYQDFSSATPLYVKVDHFDFDMENAILSAVRPVGINLSCNTAYGKLNIPVSLRSSLVLDMQKKALELNISSAKIADVNSSGKIDVTDFKNIGGELVTNLNTGEVIQYLPAEFKSQLKGITTNIGILNTAWFRYMADSKKLQFQDTVSLENGGITYKENKILENLKGKISVNDKYELKSKLNFLLAGQSVKLDMQGYGLNKTKNSKIYVDIYSPKFATEYLLALFPQKQKTGSKQSSNSASPGQSKPSSKSTHSTGSNGKSAEAKKQASLPEVHISLKADAITFKTVEAGKTTSNIKLKDNKLTVETSISAYNGTIYDILNVDLNSEKYSTDVAIKNVQVNKLIDDAIAVLPKKDPKKKGLLDDIQSKVYGSFSTKCSFSGSTFSNVAHTIKGSGNFAVRDGKLAALDAGKDLYTETKIEAFRNDMPFDYLGGDFDMSDGVINIRNFKMYSGKNGEKGDIRANGEGYVTVDTKLDFKISMDLNSRVAKQVQEAVAQNMGIKDISYAYSSDGWLPFDFRVYGTVANKRYDFNQKRMFENIRKNLGSKLQNDGQKYIQDNAKDLIKNLFGK